MSGRLGLQVFRSLWGCESHVPYSSLATIGERLALLKTTGYDGVEASLADLGSSPVSRRAWTTPRLSAVLQSPDNEDR